MKQETNTRKPVQLISPRRGGIAMKRRKRAWFVLGAAVVGIILALITNWLFPRPDRVAKDYTKAIFDVVEQKVQVLAFTLQEEPFWRATITWPEPLEPT